MNLNVWLSMLMRKGEILLLLMSSLWVWVAQNLASKPFTLCWFPLSPEHKRVKATWHHCAVGWLCRWCCCTVSDTLVEICRSWKNYLWEYRHRRMISRATTLVFLVLHCLPFHSSSFHSLLEILLNSSMVPELRYGSMQALWTASTLTSSSPYLRYPTFP